MAEQEVLERALETAVSFITAHLYLTLAVLLLAHLCVYRVLKSQPRSLWKSEPLKISELYVYPIKSLRPTRVSQALATRYGFAYDRTFMLLQVTDDGYKNMAVAHYYEMTQFLTSMVFPEADTKGKGSITVEFVGSKSSTSPKSKTLNIPLRPDTANLETLKVTMHNSPVTAFKMPSEYNAWFSSCFGYDVVLVYLGQNLRDVLFEEMKPQTTNSWLSSIPRSIPFLGPLNEPHRITFADCAPYLMVSKTSLADVSARLPEGEEMDVTKFRPNIVVEGAKEAYEEDYWGEVCINDTSLLLAHNCVRCRSLNVDYATAKEGTGESGQILKKLQKDRRVDQGAKYSPVFGRYCYWNPRQGQRTFKVGDDVFVTKVNKERTTWSWKNLG